jgi:hypothetical protein
VIEATPVAWSRIYFGDMRADPKIRGMNADMRLALLHAWGLAHNPPGLVGELRGSTGEGMGEAELRDLAKVQPQATRGMFRRWAEAGLCEIVDDGRGHQMVWFPKLARRQGIDPANAERQRRHRAKVKAEMEAARNALRNASPNGEEPPSRNALPSRPPEPEPEKNTDLSHQSSTSAEGTPPSQRVTGTVNGITPDTLHAIDALLDACADADRNTRRTFQNLAHQGATADMFHDARHSITTADPRRPAAYANTQIRNALESKHESTNAARARDLVQTTAQRLGGRLE